MFCLNKSKQEFATQLDKEKLTQNIMPLFLKLTTDDQDTVRLLTVEDLVQISRLMSNEEKKQSLLPILKSLGQDKSWRVRYMVASKFAEVSTYLNVIPRILILNFNV